MITKRLYIFLLATYFSIAIAANTAIIPHIMAYDLRVTYDVDYSFSFFTNTQPDSGKLLFYSTNGDSIGEYTITQTLQKGENTITIPTQMLPSNHSTMAWALYLSAPNNLELSCIYEGETYNRLYTAIDNNPKSDYFGHIYLANRKGVGVCEIHILDYKYQPIFKTSDDYTTFNVIGRPSIDSEGYVYWPDWGDLKSGINVMNPTNYYTTSFFKGTHDNDNGVWYNTSSSTDLGSSTPSVSIYGTGKETKLFAINEDSGKYGQLPKNGYLIYQLGNEDGTISRQWKTSPTQIVNVEDTKNGNLAIVGTSHGAWICQPTTTNQQGSYALMFYDNQGQRQYASTDPQIINGANGAGIAINREENLLAMVNADGNILLFNITWNGDIPTLTLNTTYTTAYNAISSMHFDYAGNLVTTSGNNFGNKDDLRLVIYSTPTDKNSITIPARVSQQIHVCETSTDYPHTQMENTPTKILRNGHLHILYNDREYSILGF